MTHRTKRFDLPAVAAVTCAVVCWSSTPLFVHFLVGKLGVWNLNGFRCVLVALFMFTTLAILRRQSHHHPRYQLTRSAWTFGLGLGALGALGAVLYVGALKFLAPGLFALLHEQYILWAILFAALLYRDERAMFRRGAFWLGLLAAVTGSVGLILIRHQGNYQGHWQGVLLVFIWAMVWVVYGLIIKRATRRIDPMVVYAATTFFCMIFLFTLMLLKGNPRVIFDIPPSLLLLTVLSAFFNLFLPHLCLFWATRRLGFLIPQIGLLGTAFLTPLGSYLIFDERLRPVQWFFGILLVAGVGLTLIIEQKIGTPPAHQPPLEVD